MALVLRLQIAWLARIVQMCRARVHLDTRQNSHRGEDLQKANKHHQHEYGDAIPFAHNEKTVAFALYHLEHDRQISYVMHGETTRRTCRCSKDPPARILKLRITGSGLRMLSMMEALLARSEDISNTWTSPCPSLRG